MRIAVLGFTLVMGCGALAAGRLVYADLVSRRPSLKHAAELDGRFAPASYFERLADIDADHAAHWLDAAVALNPRSSADWIAEGLASERDGDTQRAEQALLRAAAVDHQYLPAWTLANFYFRQSRPENFWTWARRAAPLNYDDDRPLLALANAMAPDAVTAVEKLGGTLRLLRAGLDDSVQRGRLGDAQNIARLLIANKRSEDAARLLALADRQIQADHATQALELWNAVRPPLDPTRHPIADGDLATAATGVAFERHLIPNAGVDATWEPQRLTFELDGNQPELCSLLEQFVPMAPARRYRLRFEYETAGFPDSTGLLWDLNGATASIHAAPVWQTAEVALMPRVGPSNPLGKLRLLYRREPGSVRARGQIRIRRFSLEVS